MPTTANQIAVQYPYLSEADQAKTFEIWSTIETLMQTIADPDAYPNADIRRWLCNELTAFRADAVNSLRQK